MAPLNEGRARAGPQQDERFGHVVFVNDVFFCAYEVLRCVGWIASELGLG